MLENVYGAITSHGGKDFATICAALAGGGYQFGAMLVDAARFLPQSRPRLFIVAVDGSLPVRADLLAEGPDPNWRPPALTGAHGKLAKWSRDAWVWWRLPPPPVRDSAFVDLIEERPRGVKWRSEAETNNTKSSNAEPMGPVAHSD